MKKILHIGVYVLYPSLLSAIYTFMLSISSLINESLINEIFNGFVFICYAIPILGFYYYIQKKPFNQWILFIGFIPVPILPYIFDYNNPTDWFQYLNTGLSIYLYTIPWIIVSLIIALVITIKNKIRKK